MSNIIVEEDSIKRPPNVLKSPPKAKDTKPFDIYVTEENNKYYLYVSVGDKLIRFIADENYR